MSVFSDGPLNISKSGGVQHPPHPHLVTSLSNFLEGANFDTLRLGVDLLEALRNSSKGEIQRRHHSVRMQMKSPKQMTIRFLVIMITNF